MKNPKTEPSSDLQGEHSLHLYSPIVELRQYALHPGQRDVLIDLFEREFVESQEVLGMRVIGIFCDLDDPNRFVWIRGYSDMHLRAEALKAFYTDGAVWKAHRKAANATMIDSDNVLLLCPARLTSGFWLDPRDLPPPGARENPSGLVVANILSFETPVEANFLDFFEGTLAPVLKKSGASILASFVTEESPNTYPDLPVREGEHVFVWFALFQDPVAYDQHVAALATSQDWHDRIWRPVLDRLKAAPQVLKLLPTARSLLHG